MSEEQELIERAKDAIGAGDFDKDWKIAPTEHAEQLGERAPALAGVLTGSKPLGIAAEYERTDHRAVLARDAFKRTASRANAAIFCTATLGALLLIAGGLQDVLGAGGRWVVGGIGAAGILSSGLAAMWLHQIKGGALASAWSAARAKAEARRLEYFKAVMTESGAAAQDQLFAFEYARRYLLDNQERYFKERGEQHESAAGKALQRNAVAAFIASAFTGLAGLLCMFDPKLALIAGGGVIASALATLLASRSALNLDRTNADRYRIARELLWQRSLDLDRYRSAVARGDEGAVQEFFEPVFVALETDHAAFLEDDDRRKLAIGGMEERLESAKAELSKHREGAV